MRFGNQPVCGQVAVQVREKGVSFGRCVDGRVQQSLRLGGMGKDKPAHAVAMHRLHRAPEGGRDLQQVHAAHDLGAAVRAARMEPRGIEEQRVALVQAQLEMVFLEQGAEISTAPRGITRAIGLREWQQLRRSGFDAHAQCVIAP
ncbi:hypothetical protein [Paracoccus sp. PARArs4]|uniref:hypothetical protein n=1 Tax=Paracoccus sp. PARArs4 TaxID=2853442 RepID=UPI0032B78FD4